MSTMTYPDRYEVYIVSSGVGPSKIVALEPGSPRPQGTQQYLGQKSPDDTVSYLGQDVSIQDVLSGNVSPSISQDATGETTTETGSVEVSLDFPDTSTEADTTTAQEPVSAETAMDAFFRVADTAQSREDVVAGLTAYRDAGGSITDDQIQTLANQAFPVADTVTDEQVVEPQETATDVFMRTMDTAQSREDIVTALTAYRDAGGTITDERIQQLADQAFPSPDVDEVDVDYRPLFDDYYNRYASSAYANVFASLPNADELFEQWRTSYDGQGDPGSSVTSFFQDQIVQAQTDETVVEEGPTAEEGPTDDELLQDYIDRISADPLNRTLVDWNTLSAENPEVTRRLTEWLNSGEYQDLVRAAQQPEVEPEAEAEPEVTVDYGAEYSRLYGQVRDALEAGQDPNTIDWDAFDRAASQSDFYELSPTANQASLDQFIDQHYRPKEPTPEPEFDAGIQPPPQPEQPPVVVTDAAGNDLEPTGTTEDFDEVVTEIIDIIDTMSFVTLDDLNDVKSSLEGVFAEYKDVITSLADAEAAKNIIDGHIETILSNALEQSSTLFATFDPEQTFGRETRSGLEVTMENIISQLEIDKEGLIAKQSNLINLRYDQALERLARKGLLEGGGISASGTNILAATDLEQQRAQDLAQAEIELDERLRGELRETLSLIDAIARSRTDEAIAQQQSRLDTSQQLLDFVVDLENLRLGSRRVSIEERGMTLEEYRSSVDEKIREAELTGRFNGEETLALREMLSRVEIENRRLDLENKIADSSISIDERAIALQELVDLKRVEIEARRYNLEEALGLRGMSLSERRLVLDEFLGNAGVEQAEREHVLNQLLGEGDLAIRKDLAELEVEQFTFTQYLEGKRLLLEEQAQEIESGAINRRIAIEENRLELDRFIANNRNTIDENALEIERLKAEAGIELDKLRFDLEERLGVGRLSQDAQALSLQERRLMLDELTSHNKLMLEERQIAFEEIMYNSDLELRERAQYIDEITKRQNLDRLDRELLMQQMLANSQVEMDEWEMFLRDRIAQSDMDAREKEIAIARMEVQLGERQLSLQERQQELDERFRIAEATGVIIDQNGFVVPTLAAKAQEQSDYLAQQGLELEAQRLQQSASQFTRELDAQTKQWADQYNLDAGQAQALQAQIYAEIERNKQQLDMQLEEMLHQQYITLEDLGLRQGELDLSKIKVSNDQELAQARLELDRNTLSAQIQQQEYDRALELQRHADNLGLEYDQLAQMWNQAAADREQALYLASQEFGLEEERLTLMRFQTEEDVRLRGLTLEQSAEQWAAEFGLEEEAALQAIRFAEEEHRARMTAMALDNNLTQTQINALNSEWNSFMQQEARRDELWSMAMDGDMLNTPEGRQKFAAFMALAQGMGYSPAYPPPEQDDGGGIFGAIGSTFGRVLGEEGAKAALRKLGVGG